MEKEGESLPIKRGEGERKRRRNSGEGCGKANWKMKEKQKQKKGMEIKGKGEGLPRNAARAFILKSRWNKSAMRTWLKKTWERKEGKGLCRVSSSKEDPSSLLPELKSPG